MIAPRKVHPKLIAALKPHFSGKGSHPGMAHPGRSISPLQSRNPAMPPGGPQMPNPAGPNATANGLTRTMGAPFPKTGRGIR